MKDKKKVKYCENLVKDYPDRPNTEFVRENFPAFHKRFPEDTERGFKERCVRQWMKVNNIKYPCQEKPREYKAKPMNNHSKKIHKVFSISNYILYINGSLFGFETKEELEAFITSNQILGLPKAFVNLPIEIKTTVKIGK
jgi:hypothetical protein